MKKKYIIISSSEDSKYYINNKILSVATPISTSFEASYSLKEKGVNFLNADDFLKNVELKNILNLSDVATANLSGSSQTSIFNIKHVNILNQLENHLKYFFWRCFEAYFIIQKLKFKNSELYIFENNLEQSLSNPLQHHFLSLALFSYSKNSKHLDVKTISNRRTMRISFQKPAIAIKKLLKIFTFPHTAINTLSCEVIIPLPQEHALRLTSLFTLFSKKDIGYILLVHNATKKGKKILTDKGINFIDRKNLLPSESASILNSFLFDKFKRTRFDISLYQNKLPNKYLNYLLKKKIEYWFRSGQIKEIIKSLLLAGELINDKTRLVITTTDPDNRVLPFIDVAKINYTKTLTIQHGAYANENTVDYKSDILLSWGEFYKKWFVKKLKKKPTSIKTVGSPFFDNIKIKKLKNSRLASKNILILTTNIGFKYSSFNKAVESLIIELEKIGVKNIYLRPHSWQEFEFLKNKSYDSTLKLADKQNLKYYLNKTNIAITMNTTAGLEAMAAGLKVIYWDFFKTRKMPFEEAGIPTESSPQKIATIVDNIIKGKIRFNEKKKQKLLKDVFFSLDGKASQRVANEIKSILKEQKNDENGFRKDKNL